MSRLVKITPDIGKEPEKPDQEFGRFIFEKIDPILVETVTLEQDLSKPWVKLIPFASPITCYKPQHIARS